LGLFNMAHLPFEELRDRLLRVKEEFPEGSFWNHYKNLDSRYKIIGHALLELDDTPAIEYVNTEHDDVPFIKPASSWTEEVRYDGRFVSRFTRLD